MEQTILTQGQKVALDCFKSRAELADLFYLSGGTALAEYYLHHRYSEDLDFFTDADPFPQLTVEAFVSVLKTAVDATDVTYRRLHDRRVFFFIQPNGEELKIEFTLYPFQHIQAPMVLDGALHVDSLHDIAANKVMALMDRIEPKDFVDLYFLLHESEITLSVLRDLVAKKFQLTLEPITLGSEFAKVRHVQMLPRMIKPLTLEELKDFFTQQARELAPEILR